MRMVSVLAAVDGMKIDVRKNGSRSAAWTTSWRSRSSSRLQKKPG